MTTHDRVRQQLHALETLLREHRHWRLDKAAGAPVYQHPTIFYGYHGTAGMAAMGIDPTYAYPT